MKNTYKITWSDESLNNLKAIIEYLENNWTEREIRKFAQLLEKRLSLIASNPFSFPVINHPKKLRKVVTSKHTTIFYQPVDGHIRILSLFDNRRNPNRIMNL